MMELTFGKKYAILNMLGSERCGTGSVLCRFFMAETYLQEGSVKVSTGPAQSKKGIQNRPCKHPILQGHSIINQC